MLGVVNDIHADVHIDRFDFEEYSVLLPDFE